MRALLLLLVLLGLPSWVWAQHVVFINPGHSDEPFWVTAGQAMQAAAHSLDMRFEQQFAERDPQRALALARALTQRPADQRPDYVVLTNEKGVLLPSATLLDQAGIKSFAAFNGLLHQEHRRYQVRKNPPLLLGSLEPDASAAGYHSAQALIAKAKKLPRRGKLRLLAVAGDRSTPSSLARTEGMRKALDEHPEVELERVVFADWRTDLAQTQVHELLAHGQRYQAIWSANDLMGLGAVAALRQHGLQPGRDALISSINASDTAMEALTDGRFAVLYGGHFLTGACALVLLYDHHHGRDFAILGLEQVKPLFSEIDIGLARTVLAQRHQRGLVLDMRRYSRHLHPSLPGYTFDGRALMLNHSNTAP
ncbi:ABC transporter substrate-binding protein [Roseateles sp. BYS180W]|uniref:ABC transporter substrate-binding protein n=1 Tax=Roseateles rivi TaxID=3299028 RepID=A0ABW7FVC3_9BURK